MQVFLVVGAIELTIDVRLNRKSDAIENARGLDAESIARLEAGRPFLVELPCLARSTSADGLNLGDLVVSDEGRKG